MNFQSRATLGALLALVFTSGAAMQAQMVVPVQDVNVSSLRERAAAGDAQAQFDLGNYYFRGRYLTLEHANALTWYRKSAARAMRRRRISLAACTKITSACRRITRAPQPGTV